LQVLRLVASGETSKAIAVALEVSQKTVGTYRLRLLKKLHAKSTADLVRFAVNLNLTSGPNHEATMPQS
jgi:DNA-binding CsgD family transcriptional regulator